jgi:hypothetical protein
MSRAERRHRSWQYARRSQRTHRRQAHPDREAPSEGERAVDCICERSVWFFEKQKISRHNQHCWMCHPKYRELRIRPRLTQFTRRDGGWPPRWLFNVKRRR